MARRDSYEGESPYNVPSTGLISDFSGEFAFLSNFYEDAFEVKGKLVQTAEHAFQAQKTSHPQARAEILAAGSPAAAKALGRRAPLRPEWESIKVEVMRQIIAAKFPEATQDMMLPPLSAKLMTTGGARPSDRGLEPLGRAESARHPADGAPRAAPSRHLHLGGV